MKCPHCNYEDGGHLGDDGKWVLPEKKYGDRFRVSSTASRDTGGWHTQTKDVYACASCGILFINTTH